MTQPAAHDADTGPIQVSILASGDTYVWSAAWIARLRKEYGVVGMLTGSLPLIPQQNVFLGVPLQLFEEEVVYLLRQKAVVLVDDAKAHAGMHTHMTNDEVHAWHNARRRAIEERQREAVEQAKQSKARWEQTAAAGRDKAIERRKEREARRLERQKQQQQHGSDGDEEGYVMADAVDGAEQTAASAKDEEDTSWKSLSHPITIPTDSLHLPWHVVKLGENAYDTLSSATQSGLWHYPRTAMDRAKCATFEDLRKRGYYMGKGLRFGGDFVVYPGDPLRYHSHFTATVQTSPQMLVSAQELVAAGRLGTAVKKAHLLCTANDDKGGSDEERWQQLLHGKDDGDVSFGQLDYYSLTWAGFGT